MTTDVHQSAAEQQAPAREGQFDPAHERVPEGASDPSWSDKTSRAVVPETQSGWWATGGRRKGQPLDKDPTFEALDPGQPNLARAYRRSRYRASQLNVLLTRYVKIRGDLSIAWGDIESSPDRSDRLRSAKVCAEYLAEARKQIESRSPNLAVAANYLALADQALVALYRPTILRLRMQTVMEQLRQLPLTPTAHVAALRVASVAMSGGHKLHTGDALDEARTALKDALSRLDHHHEQLLVEDDLQVSRLSRLIIYVGLGWLLLMAAVPFVSTVQSSTQGDVIWPVFGLADALDSDLGTGLDLLAGALGLSVVGAVGGIVSGALTVRESRATLLDYRTSMKKLALRPVFGAVAALTLYLFLSAKVVSGVDITNAGIYIVTGFLAGFSERYFLRIVNAAEHRDQAEASTGAGRPAVTPAAI